ncbi:MAG: hypothetical protein ACOYB2_11145 [Limnohabitans sp.]
MAATTVEQLVEDLTVDGVVKTYRGKDGCWCGCRGRWSYTPASAEQGSKDRGYEVLAEDVSETRVRNVVTFLKAHAGEVKFDETSKVLYVTEDGARDRDRRAVAAYVR